MEARNTRRSRMDKAWARKTVRRSIGLGLVLAFGLASAAVAWALPALTVHKTAALVVDQDGDGRADPGDTLRYTVKITNTGDTTALNMVFSDTLDANTTQVGDAQTSPVAVNDTFAALGNVPISHGPNALLVNDFGLPTPSVTPFTGTSANGGSVTVNADGSFHYEPPVGFEGADTFNYAVTNGNGADTATVTVNVSGMIWFIDNTSACSASCNGRLSHPFTSLDEFRAINDGSANHPAANDAIFLYESASDYTLSASLTLLSGQRLIGQDATTSLATLAGVSLPAGSDPLPGMNSANGTVVRISYNTSGPALMLGTNNRLYGFSAGTGNPSVQGTNFGTLAVRDVSIQSSGAALKFDTGTADVRFVSVSASGGANNVELIGVAGAVDLGTGTLSGGSTGAFRVSGGAATVVYSGTINATARSVYVQNKTTGSVRFAGPVNGTGTGVYLNNNGTAAVNFNGGLSLSTGANNAFEATTAGIVNVTGSTNTLATTSGAALRLSSYTIGAGGLTFRSISSNGGGNPGIYLNNTGTQGGLTVAGDGGGSSNGSGGTINNKSGNAVELVNTRNVSLAYMNIDDNQGSGIYGDDLTHFTLTHSHVRRNSNATDGSEANLRFHELLGNCAITNSEISNSPYDNIRMTPASGVLNLLSIFSSTVGPTSGAVANSGLNIIATGSAVVNVRVDGASRFEGNYSSGLMTTFNDSSAQFITVTNSVFDGNNIGVDLGHQSSTDWRFDISNNTFLNQETNALMVIASGSSTASTGRGRITSNQIGNGVADSGARDQYGIQVSQRGAQHLVITVVNNIIRNTDFEGIVVRSGDLASGDTGTLNLTLTGNSVTAPDDNSGFPAAPNGIAIHSRQNTSLCANIASNTSAGSNGGVGFYLRERDASAFRLQDFTTNVATTLGNKGNSGDVLSTGEPFSGSCTPQTALAPATSDVLAAYLSKPFSGPAVDATMAATVVGERLAPLATVANGVVSASRSSKLAAPQLVVMPQRPHETGLAGLLAAVLPRQAAAPGQPVQVGPFNLPPGKVITITFEAQIDHPILAGVQQVSNQGIASGDNVGVTPSDDPATSPANDATITGLDVEADLRLSKTDGGARVRPGQSITYTLNYTNAGPQHAAAVVLTETVPAHTTFNAASSTVGWVCAPDGNPGGVCTLNVGTVAISSTGSAYFVLAVNASVPAGVEVISNTTSTGSAAHDPQPADNSAADTTPLDAQPNLRITKTDGGVTAQPGDVLTYTLSYTNAGDQAATGVVLSEVVPANVTADAPGWACAPDASSGSTCTLDLGSLAAGVAGAHTFTVTVHAPAAAGVTQITNLAHIADDGANGADPNLADNTTSDSTALDAQPDLRLSKNDGGVTVQPGEPITYTLVYSNAGNQTATGVMLTETVPANTTFDSTASTAGWVCSPDNAAGSTCTLPIGKLYGAGEGSNATFVVTPPNLIPLGVSQVDNTAVIADDGANGSDPTPDNSATDSTPLDLRADLQITKTVMPSSAVAGQAITYVLQFSNHGPQASSGVVISDPIPAMLTSVAIESDQPITATGAVPYTWDVGVLMPGQGGVITVSGMVDPALLASGRYTNTATITGSADIVSGNNESSAALDVTVPLVQFDRTSDVVDEHGGSVVMTVTIAPAPMIPVSVDYATADDTALAASDYAARAGHLTFAPGQTTLTFTVAISDDNLYEGNESLRVALSNVLSGQIGAVSQATLVISDNETLPVAQFDSTAYQVGEAASAAVITVTLDHPSAFAAAVRVASADDTATQLADYAAVNTVLSFPALTTLVTFSVPVSDDLIYERDEELALVLSNPAGASLGSVAAAALTIVDDEAQSVVQFSASDYAAGEANGAAQITVTLSGPSAFTATVQVSSADGSASDYQPVDGVLTFAPGVTAVQLGVPITDDPVYEGDETFTLTLHTADEAVLGAPATVVVTITEDETAPVVQFAQAAFSATEPQGQALITITQDRASVFTTTMTLESADDTAIAGEDYTALNQTVTFAPGETVEVIALALHDDTRYELDESLWLRLKDVTGGVLSGTNPAPVTVVNDDLLPVAQFSSSAYSVAETSGDVLVTVTLNPASGLPATLAYTVSNGTATAPDDFAALVGTLLFAPGQTSQVITVTLADDASYESDETVQLQLGEPASAMLGLNAQATLTIADDEVQPVVRFTDASVELTEAPIQVPVTVELSGASAFTVTVDYASVDGTARQPDDYLAVAGPLTFTPGVTSQVFAVEIISDSLPEQQEQLSLTLNNPVHTTIAGTGELPLIIRDDDPYLRYMPMISFPEVPVVRFSQMTFTANESAGIAIISVQLSWTYPLTVSMRYTASNDTAVAPDDFGAVAGTLVFTPGVTAQTFAVPIVSDALDEHDETVKLSLGDLSGRAILDASTGSLNAAQLVIVDDDDPPQVRFNTATFSVTESASQAGIALMLSAPSGLTVTVGYSTANGTAQSPGDYVAARGVVTFAPGEVIQAFLLGLVNDALDERDETVALSIDAPTNASLGIPQAATLMIMDDDPMPVVQFHSATFAVGEGQGAAVVTVTLSAPSELPVTVRATTSDGMAQAGSDYAATSVILTFAPGITTATFSVPIVNDSLYENDETVVLLLADWKNATGESTHAATLVIVNDETAPDLQVESLVAAGSQVTVVIRNIGTAPVAASDEFWVDVYIAPTLPPTGVNQSWQSRGARGVAWGITGAALPLAPGAALTLTVGDAFYFPVESNLGGPIVPGTPVYAQVDSANILTAYGAVYETHEYTGGLYNNIVGPVSATNEVLAGSPSQVGQDIVEPPTLDNHLPPRR